MNPVIKCFYDSVLTKTPSAEKIAAKFKTRNDMINYTLAIFDELKADPDIEYIVSQETGEVLFVNVNA
ncbi:MAG: hypothetical protein J5662_01345 [Clostridia bacterium]|nr:hypothetical protein [Clostridia bacterium]